MLEQQLKTDFYPTQDDLLGLPHRHYLSAAQFLERIADGRLNPAQFRVCSGHYGASLADVLPGKCRTAIFLRDPIQRTLSMIAHRHRADKRRFDLRRLDLAAYLSNSRFVAQQVLDYQTKVLACGPTANVNAPLPVDNRRYQAALQRLESLDFIGLTDDFERSVKLFEKLSGIKFDGKPLYENATKKPQKTLRVTEGDIERIRSLVSYDLELYELARRRFHSQLAASGLHAA